LPDCKNCTPENRKCTVESFAAEASKPIQIGAFQCIEEKSGRTREKLESLGFIVLEFEGKLLRSFDQEEERVLGISPSPDRPEIELKGEKRRPYGTPPHCPLLISFGEETAA
jgi:hypothetical protein